jgi:hypothetical protein
VGAAARTSRLSREHASGACDARKQCVAAPPAAPPAAHAPFLSRRQRCLSLLLRIVNLARRCFHCFVLWLARRAGGG